MATINYENKEAISVNPTIPNKNKVVDSDMNLIKQVGNQILTTMGVYTDDWNSSSTYAIGDIVIYDNRIFRNLTGTNTATTPDEDATNWLEVSIRDISGGAEIPIQNTAPANPREDDLWIDTSEPEEMQEAIVNEYSESTNETYSCDYINKLDKYSTTEVKTGKVWIDGKPIYRKCVYISSLPDTDGATYNINQSNINFIVNVTGIAFNESAGHFFPLPYIGRYNQGINDIEVTVLAKREIRIITQSDRTGLQAYITIEYTKTTD